MSSSIRTILVILSVALLTIWLFQQSCTLTTPLNGSQRNDLRKNVQENYDNAITKHNVEPVDALNSYGVRFTPHLTKRNDALTTDDWDSFRVTDHTDEQINADLKYKCDPDKPMSSYKDMGQDIRNVDPDTSLQHTYQQGDRVTDSNDINGVCSKDVLLQTNLYAYDSKINENLPRMNMTRDEHNSMVAMRPHMKTYIEVDQSAGNFDILHKDKQTLDYADFNDTVNKYRDDTLNTIRSGDALNVSVRSKYPFYDGVTQCQQ
jgi:hypothetical protein